MCVGVLNIFYLKHFKILILYFHVILPFLNSYCVKIFLVYLLCIKLIIIKIKIMGSESLIDCLYECDSVCMCVCDSVFLWLAMNICVECVFD